MTDPKPIQPRETLILFARQPRPGSVKTRLAPLLGEKGATALYRAFLSDVAATAREVRQTRPTVGLVAEWTPDLEEPDGLGLDDLLPGPFLHRPQTGPDLGERMATALGRRLAFGGRAVLLGTDLPDLPPEIPLAALRALEEMERDNSHRIPCAALGPARDGGYYLIGLTRPLPEIFTGIEWGTSGVFEATREKLASRDIPVHFLPPWQDVDDPRDLTALKARLDRGGEKIAPHTREALKGLKNARGSDLG